MLAKYKKWLDDHRLRFTADGKVDVEVDLLPCPLCGVDGEQDLSKVVVCDPQDLDEENASGTWGVTCVSCGCVVAGFEIPADAVKRWNCRTE